ncbi:MAG: ammonium transporter [Aquificae bacterium]|nr:ammonium transporter [Aquificota bacterium]
MAAPQLDTGNTAWMLTASALVVFMTIPGLALFYGGLDRAKNILNTIAMVLVAFGITALTWFVIGYSLAYGTDIGGFIGNPMDYFLGKGIHGLTDNGYPMTVDVMFQLTFAAITTAIIAGALVGRMKFSAWILFVLLWSILVYPPIAHWVWGGGFLSSHGELDFAGGTVVHINSGVAGLVAAMMLGARKEKLLLPNNVPLVVLGAGILFFGWFGFNAGSALAADNIAGWAMLNTTLATAAAMLTWMVLEYIHFKKPTIVGLATGIVAGLVAITPAAGFVNPVGAILVGILGAIPAFYAVVKLKQMLGYDDALDAFGVHGVAGIAGAILTGIFADPNINGGAGLLYGNPKQVLIQIEGVLATVVYTTVMTALIMFIVKALTGGAKVSEEEQIEGLNKSQHGERAYNEISS